MKMKMPFDGFYLKLLDEQNGTHEYEEYLRNCKENPLTEEEQREWTESARAAIAELERIKMDHSRQCLYNIEQIVQHSEAHPSS